LQHAPPNSKQFGWNMQTHQSASFGFLLGLLEPAPVPTFFHRHHDSEMFALPGPDLNDGATDALAPAGTTKVQFKIYIYDEDFWSDKPLWCAQGMFSTEVFVHRWLVNNLKPGTPTGDQYRTLDPEE